MQYIYSLMQLYNTLSKKERAELIKRAGDKRLTLSFYKYHLIKNPEIFRNFLLIIGKDSLKLSTSERIAPSK